MELIVECYSGYTYAQEPRAFVWQGQRYIVQKVERVWRTPEGLHFRVVTGVENEGWRMENGEWRMESELAYNEQADTWSLIHAPRVG
jgi:hypothetical protein